MIFREVKWRFSFLATDTSNGDAFVVCNNGLIVQTKISEFCIHWCLVFFIRFMRASNNHVDASFK